MDLDCLLAPAAVCELRIQCLGLVPGWRVGTVAGKVTCYCGRGARGSPCGPGLPSWVGLQPQVRIGTLLPSGATLFAEWLNLPPAVGEVEEGVKGEE